MYIKRLAILFLVILFTCFMGCSNTFKNNNKDVKLPIKKEIGNYIFEIEDTRLFKDYILYKYTVTTKDGSEINDKDIYALAQAKGNTISYGVGSQTLFVKKLSSNKVENFSEIFIGDKNGDSINIEYLLGGIKIGSDNYTIEGPYLKESKNDYEYINKRFSINNMNLVFQSLGNFDFGSLVHFYMEDIENYDKIPEMYSIKIKSGNFENIYEIAFIIRYTPPLIDSVVSDGGYKKGLKNITFYNCSLLYDNKKIDPNSINIYLVNNGTREETLLYSKKK